MASVNNKLELVDRYIDEPRPLRVAVIGGGLSGVTAGILLPAKVPGIQLTIYDKNKDFAGTWLENVYPGVRCDIPSHVYQSTFAPKVDWSDQFSFGPEIRDYWQAVAKHYDVYRFAQLGTYVRDLEWNDDKGEWTLSLEDVDTHEKRTATHDIVVTAVGRFNSWKLPEYPGIESYKGHLRHASNWDPSFDPTGKRVAVIGNGASGIQLTANLQPKVKQLDHYARSKTWIASSWAGDERTFAAQPYPAEQIQTWQRDPAAYLAFRKELEGKYWRRFATFFKDSPENKELRETFIKIMRKRVEKKPELLELLVPDFSPNCRRLTPGPGYLEALVEDNVDFIRTPIRRFTETGIETEDGVQRDVDAVLCATGANVDLVPPFTVRAKGKELGDVWGRHPDAPDSHGFPWTYLGFATPGFPNLFFLQGPQGSGVSGSVPHSTETQLAYLATVLRKIGREAIRSIEPSAAAADDFAEFSQSFFQRTVVTENCSSWYNGGKPGGYINGIWPGSSSHATLVRRSPRWEDFEYTYLGQKPGQKVNRFAAYFGNGWTKKETDPNADLTPYLRLPGEVDLKDIHESWWNF